MKKALLKIGHGVCFFLAFFLLLTALRCLPSNIGSFLVLFFLSCGPTLGMLAFRNELKEQRSGKILLCLGIWIVVLMLLWLCLLNAF